MEKRDDDSSLMQLKEEVSFFSLCGEGGRVVCVGCGKVLF